MPRVFVPMLFCAMTAALAPPVFAQAHPSKVIAIPPGGDALYDEYHYAPAIRVGDMVIVSGIPGGGGDDYKAGIRRMFERAKQVLAAAGAEMSDVVEITTFHAQARDSEAFQKEFGEFLDVHKEYFPSGYPAWTAIGNAVLLAKGARVEMRLVAMAGAGRATRIDRAPKAPDDRDR